MPTEPVDPDPMPQPPVWPGDDACCGDGCDPCIFDLHAQAQARHRIALAAWQARRSAPAEASTKAAAPP